MYAEVSREHTTIIDRLLFYGFCGLFFLIPIATSPAVIAGIAILALWILSGRFIKDSHVWLRQKWTLPVIAIVLLPWIGLLYTEDVSAGLDFAKKTYYWFFAFAVAGMSLSASRAHTFIKAYIAGVSFTSLLFILQLLDVVPMKPPYSVGLFNRWGHITFSLLLTFGILLLSFYFKKAERKKDKVLCLSLMLLQFSALFVLLSDSGHLAFIVLSPLIAYNLLNQKHLLKIVALSSVIVGVLFLSPVTQSRLFQAVNETEAYTKGRVNTPVGFRYYMWTGALKIYLENPVLGVGTGGYQSAMKKYRTEERVPEPVQPHNTFLYMAVSYGIPGIVCIVWLFAVLLKSGWQNRDSLLGFSILSFMLVLFIGSLTDTQILSFHTGMLFALFTGLQVYLNENV
jgi:O-antigen ligase